MTLGEYLKNNSRINEISLYKFIRELIFFYYSYFYKNCNIQFICNLLKFKFFLEILHLSINLDTILLKKSSDLTSFIISGIIYS